MGKAGGDWLCRTCGEWFRTQREKLSHGKEELTSMANAGKGKKSKKTVVNVAKNAKANLQQGYKKGPKEK